MAGVAARRRRPQPAVRRRLPGRVALVLARLRARRCRRRSPAPSGRPGRPPLAAAAAWDGPPFNRWTPLTHPTACDNGPPPRPGTRPIAEPHRMAWTSADLALAATAGVNRPRQGLRRLAGVYAAWYGSARRPTDCRPTTWRPAGPGRHHTNGCRPPLRRGRVDAPRGRRRCSPDANQESPSFPRTATSGRATAPRRLQARGRGAGPAARTWSSAAGRRVDGEHLLSRVSPTPRACRWSARVAVGKARDGPVPGVVDLHPGSTAVTTSAPGTPCSARPLRRPSDRRGPARRHRGRPAGRTRLPPGGPASRSPRRRRRPPRRGRPRPGSTADGHSRGVQGWCTAATATGPLCCAAQPGTA